MNKQVVLILLCLMLAVGGLSLLQKPDIEDPAATPTAVASTPPKATPSTTPTPVAEATPKKPWGLDPSQTRKRPVITNGRLKAHMFSDGPDGLARSGFGPSAEAVYLVITPEGIPKRVAMTASLRSALVEDAEFSKPIESTGSPRRRVFKFEKPAKGWIPGPYQVMLKAARGKSVFGHLRFEILKKKPSRKSKFEEPDYLDLQEELDSPKRSTFTTATPKIHLRVATHKIPQGTPVKTIWSAVEVDRLVDGELVAVSERAAPDPEKDCIFVYSPPRGGFLKGAYKVDIYFEDEKVGSQAFFVQRAVETKE